MSDLPFFLVLNPIDLDFFDDLIYKYASEIINIKNKDKTYKEKLIKYILNFNCEVAVEFVKVEKI